MKIRILLILLILVSGLTQAQVLDTIHGRILSSVTWHAPKGNIYVVEKGTTNGAIADSLGVFKLVALKNKVEYALEISAGNYEKLEYLYKAEWTKRTKPKSIVVNAQCTINSVSQDYKAGGHKLYLIGGIAPIANSKSDKRFEKRFKLKYHDFGCTPIVYECAEKYNRLVFRLLDIKYDGKWRKKVRKDVIGYQ